jgi:PPM family protein phosphatase
MRPKNEREPAATAPGLALDVAGATAQGRRRINADAFLVDEAAGFLAVSDGIGDKPDSAMASRIALTLVREPFSQPWSVRPLAERFASEAAARLVRGLGMTNRRMYEVRETEPGCRGATFAGVVVCRDRLCVAHVGDSRIYVLRRATGELVQVTEDHTVFRDLLSRGVSHDIAAFERNSDALTRALGKGATVKTSPEVVPWTPGDVALVCTDGLSDFVHPEAMRRVLTETTDAKQAAERLVQAAEDVGGWDNSTVVVAQLGSGGLRGR